MKILKSVQDCFAVLGINLDQSKQHHLFNLKSLTVFFVSGTAVTLSYVSIFRSQTFKEYTDSIHMGTALTLGCQILGIVLCKTTKISELIASFEKIIDNRQNYPTSKAIFKKSDRLTEKWTKIVNFSLKVAPTWILLPKLLLKFYFYFNSDSENENLGLPFPMWFPFSTKTLIGYSLAFTLQHIMLLCLFLIVICNATLGVGTFIIVLSICDDIQNDLSSIKSRGYEAENKTEMTKQLIEFVKYYSESKQLIAKYISNIFQPIFIVIFLWGTISICSGMLVIQLALKNTILIISLISDSVWAFGAVSVCCELCQIGIDAYNDIGSDFSELDWYLFPIEIRKIVLQIETNIHNLPEFQCFGSITCERVALKQVMKKGFSLYMALRQFGK